MNLSNYGPNTNVYELMTCLFPGVKFGAFHEEMDPNNFSETTGKCSLVKTRFWIEIENEFKKCSSKPSDFFDFIKYLSEYKASGEEIVFKQCFPYIDSSNSANSIFSCSILLNQLAPLNPLKKSDEIEQLIKDCDILNGKTLKGGLFLYCARILDSKFLSFFYGKGQNNEKFIYKLLKYYDSQIAANKTQFPVSSIFNESNRWGIDWEAQYVYDKNNRCKYRFSWQKDKDEHWQTLYYYKPSNPYEYFIHECQARYTLVRIGLETPFSSIKRAKDIKKFKQYSEKGLSEVFAKTGLLKENEGKKKLELLEFYEKNYHCDDYSKRDIEGNILIGIELKDGAETFESSFFIPKNLKETITEIISSIGKKAIEKQTQHTTYKLNPKEVTEIKKIRSKLPEEARTNLSPEESEILQENKPYEILKILYKPDVYVYLTKDEKEYIKQRYLIAFSTEDVRKNTESKNSFKEIEESFTFMMNEFQSVATNKLNEETVKALIDKFYKEFFDGGEYCTKTDITSIEDEKMLKDRYRYYKKLLRAVKSVNINTSASELEDNIFAKKYLSLAKEKPEHEINLYKKQIRETIRDILLELQVSLKFLDSPQNAEDGTTLHDRISENDVINREAPSSNDYYEDNLGYRSQKMEEFLKPLKRELSKEPTIGKEKIAKYLDELRKDYRNASNKTSFIETLEKDILSFNVNCSDEELNNNYYVKTFLKSEKSFPKDTVFNMFREILYRILERKW